MKTNAVPLTYPRAVACAGALRAQPGPARTGPVTRAVWTFAMAASQLGRDQGLAPDAIERAIKKAETRARTASEPTRNAQARNCVLEAQSPAPIRAG
jgi:hypothetical protein